MSDSTIQTVIADSIAPTRPPFNAGSNNLIYSLATSQLSTVLLRGTREAIAALRDRLHYGDCPADALQIRFLPRQLPVAGSSTPIAEIDCDGLPTGVTLTNRVPGQNLHDFYTELEKASPLKRHDFAVMAAKTRFGHFFGSIMPQESYDRLMEQLVSLTEHNAATDLVGNNLLICGRNRQFYIVDIALDQDHADARDVNIAGWVFHQLRRHMHENSDELRCSWDRIFCAAEKYGVPLGNHGMFGEDLFSFLAELGFNAEEVWDYCERLEKFNINPTYQAEAPACTRETVRIPTVGGNESPSALLAVLEEHLAPLFPVVDVMRGTEHERPNGHVTQIERVSSPVPAAPSHTPH